MSPCKGSDKNHITENSLQGELTEAKEKIIKLETENEKLKKKRDSQFKHINQLKNELAEYQDKPEAFQRLRKLFQTEKKMRKQAWEKFDKLKKEYDEAIKTKKPSNNNRSFTNFKDPTLNNEAEKIFKELDSGLEKIVKHLMEELK